MLSTTRWANRHSFLLLLLQHLGTSDFDMQKLVDMGVIAATVAAMQKFPENSDLQVWVV